MVCPGLLWRQKCCYSGVRVASKSISSESAFQQAANPKPSTGSFLALLETFVGDATLAQTTGGALAARLQGESDTGSRNGSGRQEKGPETASDQISTNVQATTLPNLVDAAPSFPPEKIPIAISSKIQNSDPLPEASKSTGLDGIESLNLRTSVAATITKKNSELPHIIQLASANHSAPVPQLVPVDQTAKVVCEVPAGQPAAAEMIVSRAGQNAATRQSAIVPSHPAKVETDQHNEASRGADKEVANSVELMSGRIQSDAQTDAAPTQDGPAGSTLQSLDNRLASQTNLALESVLATPHSLSNDPNLGLNAMAPTQSRNPGAAVSATADATIAKTQEKSGTADPLIMLSGGSQSSQASSTQHTQVDIAQSSGATTKTPDASSLSADFTVQRPLAHDTLSPASASTDTGVNLHRAEDAAPMTQSHLDGADAAGTAGVNTARVIQSMSESEMRVGMHSVEFGDISIRTSITQQQLVAQITVDHRDLGNAISSHIPLAQSKLGDDYGIHASIEVSQSGASFSGERQNPQQQEQREFVRSLHPPGTSFEAETNRAAPVPVPVLDDAYRLDIRA